VKSLSTILPLLLLAVGGCVQRQLTVTSEPAGALVYMNDQEVGRTPFTRDFIWYGRYEVAVRKDGYDSLKTHTSVYAPFWQWVPLDLPMELLPVTDREHISYALRPATTQPADTAAVMVRAEQLQAKLESPK